MMWISSEFLQRDHNWRITFWADYNIFSQHVQTDEDPAPLLVSSSISSKVDPLAWHTRLAEQQPLLHVKCLSGHLVLDDFF